MHLQKAMNKSGFLPNQGNQGNIREFYFDLKYQGKIREKKKRNWKSGKNQGNFFLIAILNESFLNFAQYLAENIKDCF